MNGLTVYDQMNKESGEVYYSSSKSSELSKHVTTITTKRKGKNDQKNKHTGIFRRIINGNNAAAF